MASMSTSYSSSSYYVPSHRPSSHGLAQRSLSGHNETSVLSGPNSKAQAKEMALKILQSRSGRRDGVEIIDNFYPADWEELYSEFSDLLVGFSYLADQKQLLIEWPSTVHESHSKLSNCFRPIVGATTEYIIATNLHIRLQHGRYKGDDYIPDYGIGRKLNERTVWELFWECGVSQSSQSLHERTMRWFNGNADLKAVITLDIQSVPFRSPTAKPPRPVSEVTFRTNIDSNCPYFGPMTCQNFIWAPKIDKILLTFYASATQKNQWDVTPSFDEETSELKMPSLLIQTKINQLFGALAVKVFNITSNTLPDYYPQGFSLDWAGFYEDLHEALIVDAWRRYHNWAGTNNQDDINHDLKRKARDDSDTTGREMTELGKKLVVGTSGLTKVIKRPRRI